MWIFEPSFLPSFIHSFLPSFLPPTHKLASSSSSSSTLSSTFSSTFLSFISFLFSLSLPHFLSLPFPYFFPSFYFIFPFLYSFPFFFSLVKVSCFFSIFFGIPCESLGSCHWNSIDYIDLCLSVFRFAAKLIAGVLDFKTMIDKWVRILKCGFYSVMFSRDEILYFNEITWSWIRFNQSNRSMQ